MKKIKYLSLFLAVFSLSSSAVNVKAETENPESFSQCVMNLYKGPFTSTQATENCLNAFKGKQPNEGFSTCVERLYKGPFTSRDANDNCQKAFTNANTTDDDSNVKTRIRRTGGTSIIVIPDNSKPVRRTETQCIHKIFGNQWPDIHCSGGSSSFERRTIYLD
ncbi:MAG: hypothetical protein IGQ45_06545 [Cyanobacterium sp. T60_A2020_053]|nr:hypothetical protein [Cyanobacterium sp. T60_A2020_053]